MLFPSAVFASLTAVLVVLLYKDKSLRAARNDEFALFQRKYLVAYFCVTAADWLQGPYLYRLYEEYGYLQVVAEVVQRALGLTVVSQNEIAALYIVGFTSSMLLGPLLGSLADKYGRKRLSWVCCIIFALSCLLKVSPNFPTLMLGRVLGGISTSLLFSTFESWMIFEHNKAGFPSDWLPRTFALATFGNGVVAVIAGILANFAADGASGGHHPLRPFLLAVVFLAVGGWTIHRSWDENAPAPVGPFGLAATSLQPPPPPSSKSPTDCLSSLRPILRNHKIWMLAGVQAFFESAMYLFVFLWTPALDPVDVASHPPLGLIFGTFMLAIMLGSALFRRGVVAGLPVTRMLRQCLAAAAATLLLAYLTHNTTLLFLYFVVFEVCCGVYFPALATLRGELLPEAHRAGIMNWVRVPLNCNVVVMLVLLNWMTHHHLFAVAALFCVVAFVAHRRLCALLAYDAAQASLLQQPPPIISSTPSNAHQQSVHACTDLSLPPPSLRVPQPDL